MESATNRQRAGSPKLKSTEAGGALFLFALQTLVITLHKPCVTLSGMGFFRTISGSPSQQSWWPFLSFVLCGIVLFGYRAAVHHDSATVQQTSLGTIIQCEIRGRGHDNYCHYTFPVGDQQFMGVNRAEPDVGFGQTVTVYYDSRDPSVSALEDFSEQSRKDLRFVSIFLVVLVFTVAFVLWDRAPDRKTSDEPTAGK